MDLQQFIENIEKILNRIISPAELSICNDLYINYNSSDVFYWVEYSKFKDRPLNYARYIIIKKCTKKEESSGSAWWDNFKKQLEGK